MARLQRLKWIPMIFQAFHEAQLRRAPVPQETGLTPEPNTVPLGVNPSVGNHAGLALRGNTSVVTHNKGGKPRSQSHYVARVHRNAQRPALQSVMRELRETKKKLNRLESTHHQLNDMQQRLESQFKSLSQHIQSENQFDRSGQVLNQSTSNEQNSANEIQANETTRLNRL